MIRIYFRKILPHFVVVLHSCPYMLPEPYTYSHFIQCRITWYKGEKNGACAWTSARVPWSIFCAESDAIFAFSSSSSKMTIFRTILLNFMYKLLLKGYAYIAGVNSTSRKHFHPSSTRSFFLKMYTVGFSKPTVDWFKLSSRSARSALGLVRTGPPGGRWRRELPGTPSGLLMLHNIHQRSALSN